jgi:branched-chain amino acid transport system substrate-binding protein
VAASVAVNPFRRALAWGCLGLVLGASAPTGVEAQPPIRIVGSVSSTGTYAQLGQTVHGGHQLCVKHANEKGGVLGRRIELTVEDDQSDVARSVAIYERLLARGNVDAVFSPYSSPITDAVADVTEKHRMPMVAAGAATTSIFKKGRRFVFMLLSPASAYLEGLVDVAAKRGLKTIAVIHEDTLFPRAIAQAFVDLGKRHGLQVVAVEPYPRKTTDFSPILTRIKAATPEVLAAAGYFDDAVAITRRVRELDIAPRMYAVTAGSDLPKFYGQLGRHAELVFGATQWEPELVTLRAGGLVPIARRYPGAREFVESYQREFPGANLSYQTAQGYGACQVLLEAIRRAGTLDGEKVRDAILKMEINTVFGAFKVDPDGFQVAHEMLLFQWQDGKKVIVWPDDLAQAKPRLSGDPGRPR